MYPKKRDRLRVLALLLSFVLALCVLTGAAIAEEPFPDAPEDPTTETVEQTPAEETPETEPGGEDVPPSEPEEPEEPELPEEPPMEGAYALDADVPGGWQNRPATISVRVVDLNGTGWEKVEASLPGVGRFDVTQELLEYGCVERTMLENGTEQTYIDTMSASAPSWLLAVIIIGTLAIAGSLAGKKKIATTAGTLSTTNAMFVFLLIFIVLLVGALSFFPALALGPIAEFFQGIV